LVDGGLFGEREPVFVYSGTARAYGTGDIKAENMVKGGGYI